MPAIDPLQLTAFHSGATSFHEIAIRLHAHDDAAIAKTSLPAGLVISMDEILPGRTLVLRHPIPWGHKFALNEIPAGAPVHRYGQVIGYARQLILPGEHIHVQNLSIPEFTPPGASGDSAPGEGIQPITPLPISQQRTFLGYQRSDGKVGTRNYIAIISSVNCSAHVCQAISAHFSPERLSDYPNIDGVIAMAHHTGCGLGVGSSDYILLQRTLAGMARHPNVGASLLIGLGCESNQPGQLVENCGLCSGPVKIPACPEVMTIQESGGIRKTVQAGIEAVEALLPQVNNAQRTPQPISELKLALQCGGSDAWSGITANPVVGAVADEIVRSGGTVVLAETPEIIGAEHLLARRAVSPEIVQKLFDLVRWWEGYAQKMGFDLESNRSVGNASGGLTTLYEKSLGATAKAGSTPLTAVYHYAEPVTGRGFTFMDSPGYDPVSVTGQVAGGCNVVLFTTGRGSVFGFKPAPSIKICSNSPTYARMQEDMDFNAGLLLEGIPKEKLATDLLEMVIKVASGQPSLSEAQEVGEAEFTPWIQGGVP